MADKRDLGMTKDGYKIVARGIAEDNSGIVAEIYPDRGCLPGLYEVRLGHPIQDEVNPDEDCYVLKVLYKDVAIDTLYEITGNGRLARDGPGF